MVQAQHPAAMLRKAKVLNPDVIKILKHQSKSALRPIATPEGISQILTSCDMVKAYVQEVGPLQKTKIRFKCEKRQIQKVVFSCDTVLVVLKTDDYNGRNGQTLYVVPGVGVCNSKMKLLRPMEELLPDASLEAFEAQLEQAGRELQAEQSSGERRRPYLPGSRESTITRASHREEEPPEEEHIPGATLTPYTEPPEGEGGETCYAMG